MHSRPPPEEASVDSEAATATRLNGMPGPAREQLASLAHRVGNRGFGRYVARLVGETASNDGGPAAGQELGGDGRPSGLSEDVKPDGPAPRPAHHKGKGGDPPKPAPVTPAGDAPELLSGTLSVFVKDPWHFTGPNPPTGQSSGTWNVACSFKVGSTSYLDMPLGGPQWDVGLVQNMWLNWLWLRYPPPLGLVIVTVPGSGGMPLLDCAEEEAPPFMHGYVADGNNPAQYVSRTSPTRPAVATPDFTDVPGTPVRQAVPLKPDGKLPPVDPTEAAQVMMFSAFLVAKSRDTPPKIRVIAVPEKPYVLAYTLQIEDDSTPATLKTVPGSTQGLLQMNLVKIPREQQAPDFNMARTAGPLAVKSSQSALDDALAARGYKYRGSPRKA